MNTVDRANGGGTIRSVVTTSIPEPEAPPEQDVSCSGCGLTFREGVRRPCLNCGSLNRSLTRTTTDGIHDHDEA